MKHLLFLREAQCRFCDIWLPCGPQREKTTTGHGRLFGPICRGGPKGRARLRIRVTDGRGVRRRLTPYQSRMWWDQINEGTLEVRRTRKAFHRVEVPDLPEEPA